MSRVGRGLYSLGATQLQRDDRMLVSVAFVWKQLTVLCHLDCLLCV